MRKQTHLRIPIQIWKAILLTIGWLMLVALLGCIPHITPTPTITTVIPDHEVTPISASTLTDCATLDDLVLATNYVINNQIPTSGVTFQVMSFIWSNGTVTYSGHGATVVDDMPLPNMGYSLFVNNVNLGLLLDSGNCFTIEYCDKGGNENLLVNGINGNTPDLSDLNNTNMGGVEVTVDILDPQQNCGVVTLKGDFQNFVFDNNWNITFGIGGQELYIDNVCPCK
jgi:hypothetical protein